MEIRTYSRSYNGLPGYIQIPGIDTTDYKKMGEWLDILKQYMKVDDHEVIVKWCNRRSELMETRYWAKVPSCLITLTKNLVDRGHSDYSYLLEVAYDIEYNFVNKFYSDFEITLGYQEDRRMLESHFLKEVRVEKDEKVVPVFGYIGCTYDSKKLVSLYLADRNALRDTVQGRGMYVAFPNFGYEPPGQEYTVECFTSPSVKVIYVRKKK